MKKNIVFISLLLLTGLFPACSGSKKTTSEKSQAEPEPSSQTLVPSSDDKSKPTYDQRDKIEADKQRSRQYMNREDEILEILNASEIPESFPKCSEDLTQDQYSRKIKEWIYEHPDEVKPQYRP